MPSEFYNRLSDDDVAAIVAYIRSVPPVDREYPPSTLGPLGRALLVAGQLKGFMAAFDIDHAGPRDPTPPAGPSAEYGAYLAIVGGCKACHGPTLSGGVIPGGPPVPTPPPNITPEGLKAYDEAAFFRALREGKRPDGSAIDTTGMPIPMTKLMTDDETRALWVYLQSVPPKPFGGR
jgi:mono/diheme cytochrome c family protein